jgi:FkbM family methyltransferase
MGGQSYFALLLLLPVFVASVHHFGKTSYFWEWDSGANALAKKSFVYNVSEPSPTLTMDLDVNHHRARASQDIIVQDVMKKAKGLEINLTKTNAPLFFVDLAANHYAQYSNTFVLERQFGWIGICIEPNPTYTAGLLANRKCKVVRNVVTANNGDKVDFKMTDGQGGIIGSNFDNNEGGQDSVTIVGVNLNAVLETLEAPNVIDYLSLDVEGAETYVLQSFDFNKHIFLIMTVERPKKEFHEIAVANGYWWVNRLEVTGEMLYVHKSIGNFYDIMSSMRGTQPVHKWSPHAQPHTYLLKPAWPVVDTQ